MIEAANKDRGVGAHGTGHGDASIFQSMVRVLEHQSLLWIQCQQLVLGNVEEGSVKDSRVLCEKMATLYVKL